MSRKRPRNDDDDFLAMAFGAAPFIGDALGPLGAADDDGDGDDTDEEDEKDDDDLDSDDDNLDF